MTDPANCDRAEGVTYADPFLPRVHNVDQLQAFIADFVTHHGLPWCERGGYASLTVSQCMDGHYRISLSCWMCKPDPLAEGDR